MSAITGLTELIYHAAGIGGGMTGTQISEAIRSVRAEAWDDGVEAAIAYRTEYEDWRDHVADRMPEPPTNPYRDET